MLFNGQLALGLLIWRYVLQIFPAVDVPTQEKIYNFYISVRENIGSVNWIFPVDTFFGLVHSIIIIEFSILSFKLLWAIAMNGIRPKFLGLI